MTIWYGYQVVTWTSTVLYYFNCEDNLLKQKRHHKKTCTKETWTTDTSIGDYWYINLLELLGVLFCFELTLFSWKKYDFWQ